MNTTTQALKKSAPSEWGTETSEKDAQDAEHGISGPHFAADGADHYRYWRCVCGNETTDATIAHNGCWDCGRGR